MPVTKNLDFPENEQPVDLYFGRKGVLTAVDEHGNAYDTKLKGMGNITQTDRILSVDQAADGNWSVTLLTISEYNKIQRDAKERDRIYDNHHGGGGHGGGHRQEDGCSTGIGISIRIGNNGKIDPGASVGIECKKGNVEFGGGISTSFNEKSVDGDAIKAAFGVDLFSMNAEDTTSGTVVPGYESNEPINDATYTVQMKA